MGHKDYYRILGVPRSASGEDIRRAYRRLAREHHPDRNEGSPESEERLKEINEAYRVLGDPDRKKDYDRSVGRSVPVRVERAEDVPSRGADRKGVVRRSVDPFDILFEMLGGRSAGREQGNRPWEISLGRTVPGKRSAGRKGPPVVVELALTERERREGVEREIRYRIGGRMERLMIRIPPGLPVGGTIRMAGRGEDSPWGGPPGDLVLVVADAESAPERCP
ncbi:DnaJ domain-containing protein [Desulfacinum infernum DSM 9756]|uniref:DnaJ domain-containing protein n=1 Tax=Desulfacinum infernum DSM 9756 TaxID=1121391 RepID=A0A1M5DGM6_9BACT|nr:DnaJ domain-containing protein [Desulfacinum infernum]SHF66076.1 DnaJ domain-containing protein [Desulfacinum infernum DSM 9756]